MRYEVIIERGGDERIVARTRRENGAIAERDAYADSEYANLRKHAEVGGRVVMGADGNDPNALTVVYYDELVTVVVRITYRRVVREVPLTAALAASLSFASCGLLTARL